MRWATPDPYRWRRAVALWPIDIKGTTVWFERFEFRKVAANDGFGADYIERRLLENR